jgi:GTPase Era involved in 16S rRNA processing
MIASHQRPQASSELSRIVNALRVDGDGLLQTRLLTDLAAGAFRLEQARCNVIVLGAFKRGKSTLLNALLERDVLPVGVLPLTSAATIVRHDESERLVVHFVDGRAEEHPLEAVATFTTEPSNPRNERGVDSVEVLLRHPLLTDGLQLVDTPGIASIHGHNTRVTYDTLGRVDAALCVMSADQPLAEQEAELYQAATEHAGQLLYVLTKADLLDGGERTQAMTFIGEALRELGVVVRDGELLAVSAVEGLGLPELRERLRALVAGERDRVVPRAVARTARVATTELVRSCRLEIRALELPLDELARRAELLDERLGDLEAAHADANDLMQRRVSRLLKQRVNEPLLQYAPRHAAELGNRLRARASELSDHSPRDLAGELDGWIDATVRAMFPALADDLTAILADELNELAAAHTRRIARLLDEVRAAAADALGVGDDVEPPAVALPDPAGFTFKLHDPQHALDILVGSARRAVPGALGRRLVIRDAQERLRAMTDRHAGRLRAELVARAEEAIADHRRHLDALMLEARASIRRSVQRARRERAHGADATRARLDDLRAREARALADQRRLTAIIGDTP